MRKRIKRRSFIKSASLVTIGLGTIQRGFGTSPGIKHREQVPLKIGGRRELFVDDYLIESLTGGAQRRLHHPVAREVIMTFGEYGQPWEGDIGYPAVIQDGARILLYYSGRPAGKVQVTCVLESTDGLHFTRPNVGLYDFDGSKRNNIVWRHGVTAHNFTPFIDLNPSVPADQRFKALAYYPHETGLGAYASMDGIHWRMLAGHEIIPKYNHAGVPQPWVFDSQNLAFWDTLREMYVCYFRGNDPGGIPRGIWRSTSADFIHWTDPVPVRFLDNRMEQMYTNGIRPYCRAPHINIGTPVRYVAERKKDPGHPYPSVNDVVLMSSRDGIIFNRWEEAFIRPGPETELWTDRNYYLTQDTVQTSPTELTFYWKEHNRHPTNRLRRGTMRVDGFVSVHAGGNAGEMLTRPFVFSGDRLTVNYSTSAIGTLQFELCNADGTPIEGFDMDDSEVLFGNEIEHEVHWKSTKNLSRLAGRPVRLRVGLHDADLYSICFKL